MKVLTWFRGTKILLTVFVCLCVVVSPIFSFNEAHATSHASEIDTGITNLQYDSKEVLAVDGEEIGHFVPKEGIHSNGKFIVIEREKKSLTTTPVDISIIDSIANRTYPGAIQLANRDFADNQPTLLTTKRKPLNISIDLPGMRRENTVTVENPTYGNISGAVDELVSFWNENYGDTHSVPARIQYAESMVYSKSQIANALNVNGQILDNSLGIDFDSIISGESKMMVAAYKQIFYTVSAELPNQPSDLFDDSVTFEELTRKGVSNESPPVMVSNVSYGRTIYVKLETTSKSKDVQAAFKALLQGADVETIAKYKDIYETSSFTAVVLGGNSQEHNKVVTKDFEVIRNVIKDNAEFSLQNPAYPISYTSVFLKDHSIAVVRNNTEYIETKTTEYSKGKITLDHTGAYVARFIISWDEFSYDADGNEILSHITWSGNGEDKTAHYSTVIPLSPNTKNIRIKVKECTGLPWEWWRTIIDEHNVPLSDEITVSTGGTSLYPTAQISY